MKRDYFFDNAKALLIILVVIGHLLEPIRQNSIIAASIYKFVYLFHMPFFTIISGYFSKKESDKKDIQYLILYLMAQVVMTLILKEDMKLFTPQTALWYLLALFNWRIMIRYIKDFKYPIAFALVVALLSGYLVDSSSVFALQRTLTFLPFFVIGYRLGEGQYAKYFNWLKKWQSTLALIVTAAIVYVLLSRFNLNYRNLWFAGDKSYEVLGQYYDLNIPSILIQLGTLSISTFVIAMVANLIPKKELALVSYIGKNSLCVYILHVVVWTYLKEWGFYDLGFRTSYVILISVGIVLVLVTPPIVKAFRLLTENRIVKENIYILQKRQL